MNKEKTILLYCEDPGACNVIMGLLLFLKKEKAKTVLLCHSQATQYLKQRGIRNLITCDEKTSNVSNILKKYKPYIVITGTSENKKSFGLKLIKESKENNILTAGYVDSPASTEKRFAGSTDDFFAFAPHYILAPCEITKNEFAKLGFPKESIFVIGNLYYDWVREFRENLKTLNDKEEKIKLFGKDSVSKKIITFASEKNYVDDTQEPFMLPQSYKRKKFKSDKRTSLVLELVIEGIKNRKDIYHLNLLLHPKDDFKEYEHLQSGINQVINSTFPLKIAYYSDLVIGLTTSLLTESQILGTNSLSVLLNKEEKKFTTGTNNGLIRTIYECSDLYKLLKRESTYKKIDLNSILSKISFSNQEELSLLLEAVVLHKENFGRFSLF